MDEESPLLRKESADDALRKIGRNLLCFQHVERLLKFLLSNRQWAGSIDQGIAPQERRNAKINAKSMGQLVGQFAEEFLTDEQPKPVAPTDIGTAWMSINFSYAHNDECRQKLQAELEVLVTTRNDLIHHFLPTWNSIPMVEIHRHLDQQYEKLQPMLARLKADAEALQRGKMQLAEWIASDESRQQFELSWLRASPLVIRIGNIARHRGDADGWVPLSTAGQLLHQYEADEVTRMQNGYGHKTLKSLLLATQLFDVTNQPTSKGVKVVYRIKPCWRQAFSEASQPVGTPSSPGNDTLLAS